VPEAFITAHDALLQAAAPRRDGARARGRRAAWGWPPCSSRGRWGLRALGTARTAAKLDAVRGHGAQATLAVPAETARDEPALRTLLGEFVRAATAAAVPTSWSTSWAGRT
jgi:hypothetical protein